tara:strand:- start:727 stop:1161 length:435 start_codon:yes stop_codon:yes gene_type:complete
MKLIHYGSNEFDIDLFKEPKNGKWVKPDGGLWTSPLDSVYGWKEWCIAEEFQIESYYKDYIIFDYTGNTFVIDSVADLYKLKYIDTYEIDFTDILNEYDAIHLTVKGQERTRHSTLKALYWDCETVFIINPKSIKPISKEQNDI